MSELTTVDVKRSLDSNGKEIVTVRSNKTKETYTISKTNDGYTFYSIVCSKAKVAEELSCYFTNPDKALEALLKYLARIRPTAAVRRDAYQEKRKKRLDASKPISDTKDNVQ